FPSFLLYASCLGSHFAGGWNGFQVLFTRGSGMRSGNDQNDRSQNHNGGNDRARRDGFAHNEPAEYQRHHRIHKGIGGNARGRTFLQKVKVRGEADAGTKYDQVRKRSPRTPSDSGKMEAMKFSGEKRGDEKHRAADKTLHRHAREGRTGHAAMLRVEGPAS